MLAARHCCFCTPKAKVPTPWLQHFSDVRSVPLGDGILVSPVIVVELVNLGGIHVHRIGSNHSAEQVTFNLVSWNVAENYASRFMLWGRTACLSLRCLREYQSWHRRGRRIGWQRCLRGSQSWHHRGRCVSWWRPTRLSEQLLRIDLWDNSMTTNWNLIMWPSLLTLLSSICCSCEWLVQTLLPLL